MESKFIIFLAFVTLSQCSANLRISHDSVEKDLPSLSKIRHNQKASNIAYGEGFEPVFDTLNKLVVELVFDLKPKTHKDSSKLVKGLARVKNAVDLSLDSVLLVRGKSCSAVEVARSKTHDILDDTFESINIAVESANSGDYHQNRSTIGVHRAAVQKDFTNLNEIIYSSIVACLHITDADAVAVIKSAREGSRIGLFHLTNAVFNAIDEYADAVATENADISLVSDIEEFRSKAFVGIKNDAEYKFSALKTFYIDSQINERRILSGLAAIQYGQTVGSKRYNEAMDAAFGTVIVLLRRVALKLQDDGKDDFTRNDVALRTVIAKFDAADVAIFSSLLVILPDSSVEILKAQTEMFALEDVGVGAFYDAIYAAAASANNYTVATQKIEEIRNLTVSLASFYTGFFFRFLLNNQSFDEKTKADLKSLNDEAIRVDEIAMGKFFDAVSILARASYEGVVRKGDFRTIRTLLVESNSGLDEFTEAVAAASLIVLRALNVS